LNIFPVRKFLQTIVREVKLSDTRNQGRPKADAIDAAALGPTPLVVMVVGQVVYFCQILLAHENCRQAYKSHS